ncbi:MAG: type I restriction-modification system subunit M N-terminal domain-containing protein, partial [Cyanobium sp.]
MSDQEQLDDFLEALEKAGSPARNPVLRQALGWEEGLYEEVKAELVARGIAKRGRGRSDSVSLVGAEPVAPQTAPAKAPRKGKGIGNGTANLGFEAKLWLTADKLRNNMDAAEYKHVVLGLIFLKYISDSFEEHRAKLLQGEGNYEGANPEDPDEYKAENVFWVPA